MTWDLWGLDRTAAVVPGSTIFRGIDLSDFPDDLVSRAHRAIDGTADPNLHDDLLNHVGGNHGFSGWWTDDPDNAKHYAAGGDRDDNPLRAVLATDWNGEGQDHDYTDDEVGEDDVPLRDEPPRPHTVLVNRPGSGWVNISHHPHTAARTAMPTYYHVAPANSRDSILQHGLDYAGASSPWGDSDGNYFWEHPDDARDYAQRMTSLARDDDENHPGYVVLPLDYNGPVRNDPEGNQPEDRGGSFYTTDPIPPEAFHTASRTAMPAPTPHGMTTKPFGRGDEISQHITTKDPTGWPAGPGVAAFLPGHPGPVGYIDWHVDGDINEGPHGFAQPNEVHMIEVHPDYQRHGVATALYDHARALNPDLRHSKDKTPEGESWVSYEKNRPRKANTMTAAVTVYTQDEVG